MGPARASWRCRSCSWPAATTGPTRRPRSGWRARSARTPRWRSCPGPVMRVHLEQPKELAQLLASWVTTARADGVTGEQDGVGRHRPTAEHPIGRDKRVRGDVDREGPRRSRDRTRTAAPAAPPRARAPAATPTDVSCIDVGMAGTPASSASSSAASDTAAGLDLQHQRVGGAELPEPTRVVGSADALVGRDRHRRPPAQLERAPRGSRPAARRARGRTGRAAQPGRPRCRGPTRRWRRPATPAPAPMASRTAATSSTSPSKPTLTFTAG